MTKVLGSLRGGHQLTEKYFNTLRTSVAGLAGLPRRAINALHFELK